jgi:GNAT superfamily N-acetyltransferase
MNGLIAYHKHNLIGWFNVVVKKSFAKIPYEKESSDKIASLICFIIALSYRKQGIAKQLLRYACSISKNKGYNLIEVYPKKGENISDTYSYQGPYSLYTSEGFSINNEFEDFYVMCKKL